MDRRAQQHELNRLKDAFRETSHPNITAAFDAAEDALVKIMGGDCDRQSARNVTMIMLKAVMERGFMIIHNDELHNALLASAQAGKILLPETN